MVMRAASIRLLLVACLGATVAARPDRRIVDLVSIGDARSEQAHAYEGADVVVGTSDGRSFRETRGWMRYALTVFDDTEVTISCTFVGVDAPRLFELIVENRVVSVHMFHSAKTATIDLRVPLELTKGHTNILVMLRAKDGPTPALVELRSVQDHNE